MTASPSNRRPRFGERDRGMCRARARRFETPRLELHHDAHGKRRLFLAQIGEPEAAGPAAAGRLRGHQVARAGGRPGAACEVLRGSVVPPRRRDATTAREIRYVRVAISDFPPEGDELRGVVLEVEGAVPLVRLESWSLRKIHGPRDGICSVDGREERQISARIAHDAATGSDSKLIVVEPDVVVRHPALELLYRPLG